MQRQTLNWPRSNTFNPSLLACANLFRELEGLLNCKIATTPLSNDYKNKAKEYIEFYPRLPAPFETPLYHEMERRFGNMEVFSRLFKASKAASTDIGRWASDKFWSFALTDEQVKKTESKVNRQHGIGTREQSVERLDDDIALLHKAQQFISSHQFGTPTKGATDLSMKVLSLHKILSAEYELPTANRCIVFVERRATARLLQLIFEAIGGPHLRVGLLTGLNSLAGDLNMSFRQQVLTMNQFKNGDLNCLFATSVAEEGLDIPDCNLIIRFDLCKTMIQFIQSKGRARHRNSKYIEMVEVDNARHKQAIYDARKATDIMRVWCETLPADRTLRGNDFDWEINDKKHGRIFTHPVTGAKLTYSASLVVLSHFTSSLVSLVSYVLR
jgi:endoribonuclease Dicer